MKTQNYYLFGIIFNHQDRFYKIETEDGMVEFCKYKDLAAPISNSVPFVDLENSDKKTVAHLLIRHQKTLEKIMGDNTTVLPMKLGTYLDSKVAVESFLKDNYFFIKKLETSVINKIEVDLVAIWANFPEVLANISSNQKIKELKETLINKPGGATVQDQQQLGFMIAGIIKENNKAVAKQCYEYLNGKYIEKNEHDVMDDEMIFNTSFLVEKNILNEFNSSIDTLDELLNGKLNFRYVGPLPCYSFYCLETVKTDFRKITEAQKVLELSNSADLAAIKKSFREKAVINHPDKKGNCKTEINFEQINKAYKTLINYFNAEKSANPEFNKIVFSDMSNKQETILVKIKD